MSEDVHTGFNVLNDGWRVKYIPVCLATGVCPDNLSSSPNNIDGRWEVHVVPEP
jgi:cellulose synthase/poly-beta-1,6-N-acetylglucosamine synthase-like glycosyltransferase